MKRLKFAKNNFGTILNPSVKMLSSRAKKNEEKLDPHNSSRDDESAQGQKNTSQQSNRQPRDVRRLDSKLDNLTLPQKSNREFQSKKLSRPASSNKVTFEQSALDGVSNFFQNLERKYTNKVDKEYSQENITNRERKESTNCPLDLNEWVRNSLTKHRKLKVVDSEYPFEMLYNPVFDTMEERFDTGEHTRIKILPVVVSIDEKYSRNKEMKNAARITMKIIDGFETKECFYYNGLPSKKGKVVIPDPKPIDDECFESSKRSKLLK